MNVAEGRPPVLVAAPLADPLLARLSRSCDVTVVSPAGDPDGFPGALAGAEGIILTSRVRLDAEALRAAGRLRVVSTMSVGLDHIDLPAAAERGIAITTTPVLSDAVADLVLALMIMLARRLPESARLAASGRWTEAPLGHDLAGKTLLIVGFGRIGQEVARRAVACRMLVRFLDRRSDLPTVDGVEREFDLLTALARADFVSLHVDLNASTRHLIGAEELSAMKPTAYLVNAARGGVVDESALRRALSEGRLAGAGIDVLEHEPPEPGEPLLADPRVIVLPHIGSATSETRTAMAELAVDNLLACLQGKACAHVVSNSSASGPPAG